MAESFVQLPPDSTGKKLRSEELLIAGNTVHQEVLTLALANGDLVPGTLADGILVNLGANNDVVVSGTVAATQSGAWTVTADTELTTGDLDTGAGVDTRAVVGLVGSAVGGGQIIPGTAADGLLVNLGTNNDVVVSGAVSITEGGRTATVRDTGASDSLNVSIVDAAGNQIVSFGGGTGVSHVDDAPFTVGTDDVVPVAGIYRTVRDTVTDNDAGALAMTERRAILACLETPAGDSAMDETNDAVRVNVVTGAAAGTEYAEDTPSGAGDIGVFALTKRQDTPAADTDTDGDRARLTVDAVNRLWVNGSSVTQPISAGSLPLPAGAATSALQLPDGHNVTVDNAGAGAAVNIQDGGNIITVDGSVTVTPGTGPTDLGKAESSPHASGDVGVMALAVRSDAPGAFAANGQYTPLSTDQDGNLRVKVDDPVEIIATNLDIRNLTAANDTVTIEPGLSPITVDGAVTVSGAVSIEDIPDAQLLADNDPNPSTSRIGANNLLWDGANWDRAPGNQTDGQLVNLGVNNDVTVTSGSITADTELPAAAVLSADNVASPTAPAVGSFDHYFDGTNWDRVRGDSTDGALVNLGANNDVTVAGVATAANQVTEIASLSIMDDWDNGASDGASVSGDVAHDSADAGEPVKVGGVAVSGSASPTSVAPGDRTRFIANQHGIPYHIAGHPNLNTREYDFGSSAQTNVNLAAAAVAADERVYVTRFEATNDARTTAAGVSVRAGFGTAAVPTASATGVSGMIGTHPGLAPGSGILEGTGAGVIAVGGAGEEPYFTCEAATGGNIHVLISYFLIDETP